MSCMTTHARESFQPVVGPITYFTPTGRSFGAECMAGKPKDLPASSRLELRLDFVACPLIGD